MILVDTGVLFGAVDRDDPRHRDCAAVLEAHAGSLAVSVPVLIESAWLIESRLGRPPKRASFAASTQESSSASTSPTPTGKRVVELIDDYHDLGLGAVDASIVAVAEPTAGIGEGDASLGHQATDEAHG